MKKVVLIIIEIMLVVLVLGAGVYFVAGLIEEQQGYLAFLVLDEESKPLQSTNNNALAEGETYTFTVDYTYRDKKSDGTEKYNVSIMSYSEKLDDYYIDGEIYGWSYGDYSEAFNLKVEENSFSITIPVLSELCKGFTDENGEEVIIYDVYNYDSFILEVSSYDNRVVIQYSFHFTNNNEIVLDEINCGKDIVIPEGKFITDIDLGDNICFG